MHTLYVSSQLVLVMDKMLATACSWDLFHASNFTRCLQCVFVPFWCFGLKYVWHAGCSQTSHEVLPSFWMSANHSARDKLHVITQNLWFWCCAPLPNKKPGLIWTSVNVWHWFSTWKSNRALLGAVIRPQILSFKTNIWKNACQRSH